MPLDPMRPCAFLSPAGEAFVLATCGQVDGRLEKNEACLENMPVVLDNGENLYATAFAENRPLVIRH